MTTNYQTPIELRRKNNDLLRRVLNVRDLLPEDYMPLIIHYYPEYGEDELKKLMRNVVNLRAVDERATIVLETVIEAFKNS